MKLQISFDQTNLEDAIKMASSLQDFADILEVGSGLIFEEGIKAIREFKKNFTKKELFADLKIIDKVETTITNYSEAGANYVSILAGASNSKIQNASKITRGLSSKIVLDLIDSCSTGQSAMDAKALDIDIIIFHSLHEDPQLTTFLEKWQEVRGNTNLPIFISGNINKNNIEKIIQLKPQGIIIGAAITSADNPVEEAKFFNSLIHK